MALPPEQLGTFPVDVVLDELTEVIDDGDRVRIAFMLRIPPGEEPVSAEHDPIAASILVYGFSQHHRQLKTRTLPWQPNQFVSKIPIEFLHLVAAVRRRGQSDSPVRVEMIDMLEWKKTVERSVNGGRNSVVAERTKRIHLNHLVLEVSAPVSLRKSAQLLEV